MAYDSLREFPASSQGDYSIQRIMVLFQHGYTDYDIKKINEYTQRHGGRIVYVKNKSELVDFLKKRKEKKRLVKKMVFFCHGIINIASFHYAGENESAGEFTINDIESVYESVFDYDAEIITYACRAGISVDGSDLTGMDAGQKDSPAQKMADTWDVEVRAFEMRSSYVGTYGTGKEIQSAKNYDKVVKKYEAEVNKYKEAIAKGDKNASSPHKPDDYEVNVRRNEDVREREINEDNGGGPISPNGSWRFPTTGDTPAGLKRGLQLYTPIEWRE